MAGSTAATLFARAGASVALVERRPDPQAHKTICTHLLQAGAVPTLERLGLTERLERAGAVRNQVRPWTRWGWLDYEITEDYPYPPHGYGIRRETLDPIVREMATDEPNVESFQGYAASQLVRDGRRIAGLRARRPDGQELELRARLVVGADGRDSTLAKLAKVRAIRTFNGRAAFFAHYKGVRWEDGYDTKIWFLDPDGAGAFLCDDDVTLLATLITKDQVPAFKADPAGNFERLFTSLPGAPDLEHAERLGELKGRLDMTNVWRIPTRPGLALIGDAALAADPLQGIGIGWAFQSAELLADTTAEAVVEGAGVDAALRSYRWRHLAAFTDHHLMNEIPAKGKGLTFPEQLALSASARDQASAEMGNAYMTRSIPVRKFLAPRWMARWTAVNAGHFLKGAPEADDEGMPEVEGVRHRYVDMGGWRMHVAEAGEGEPLLMLHGWPQHWYVWRHLIPELAKRYRVICPDLRGFGWSDAPPTGYETETLARDVVAMMDSLGLERVKLVGHDWGGLVGFLISLHHPERVERYLAASVVHPWLRPTPRVLVGLARLVHWAILNSPAGPWALRHVPFPRFMLWSGAKRRRSWTARELDVYTRRIRSPERIHATIQLYRTYARKEFPRMLRGRYRRMRLRPPTHLILGGSNPIMRPFALEGYESHADEMSVEVIPNLSHFVFDEAPDLMLSRILRFFGEQPEADEIPLLPNFRKPFARRAHMIATATGPEDGGQARTNGKPPVAHQEEIPA